MRNLALLTGFLFASVAGAGETIHVGEGFPIQDMAHLNEAFSTRRDISEVVIHKGVYQGGIHATAPAGLDTAANPLLIRADDGEHVFFDGGESVGEMKPVENSPGVFSRRVGNLDIKQCNPWDAAARIRYQRVADLASVIHFPASFTIESETLYVHTHDSFPPVNLQRAGGATSGCLINRSHVTLRGIAFRNYRLNEKWSTGIVLNGHHITVEDCFSENTSLGITIHGNDNVVRRCTVRDCGGGIYIGGERATVEDCRAFKRRDSFIVPMNPQDDSGIQFYYPAQGGTVRGNLCVGFDMGIFIKASHATSFVIEHNTVDGAGQLVGFGSTKWREGDRFRFNIIVNTRKPIDISTDLPKLDLPQNILWSPQTADLKPIGEGTIVADPKFVAPQWDDYRLANDSPALKVINEGRSAGAFAAIGKETLALGEPRTLHVSPAGRDGFEGSEQRPWRTIQHAVDRAKPGDTILLRAGLYDEPVLITRGGLEGRPLIIRSAEKWKAILDINRKANVALDIREAPYVEIHDLEIRWYGKAGIGVNKSPHVTVVGCRVWNDHWGGTWPTGGAVSVEHSPHFTGHHNVMFGQEHGFWLHNSPQCTLTQNTLVMNLFCGIQLINSAEHSIIVNNLFAWNGSDSLVIYENREPKVALKNLTCDYNLYVTQLRPDSKQLAKGTAVDSIDPPSPALASESKAIFNYTVRPGKGNRIFSLKAWQEFSGVDAHSIFADPRLVAPERRDFRLQAGSPALSNGKDGVTIGAFAPTKESK